MRFIVSFILFILTLTIGAYAQSVGPQVVNSAGQQATYLTTTHEWSVGELALVESMILNENSLTNGFLQPYKVWDYLTLNSFNIHPTNILTVNNDGENDAWVIQNLEAYPDNEVSIFDRFGRMVFNAKNYTNTFNGYYKNERLNEDTYFYVIKLTKDNKIGYVKGFITVIVK